MQKWIRRNQTEAVLFAIGIGMLALNSGGITKMLAEQEANRQIATQNNQLVHQIQLANEKNKELAEVANARFDAGCELILSLEKPDRYRALSEGTPVLDGALADKYRDRLNEAPPQAFLPAGKTVCDTYGATAVLVNEPIASKGGQVYPVARQFAVTEDRERIRKAMERVRAKWFAGQN